MEFAILDVLKKNIISVDCWVHIIVDWVILLKFQNTLIWIYLNVFGTIKH